MPTSGDFAAYLAESFKTDGFAVVCAFFADGERFSVFPRDEATGLHLLYEYDLATYAPLKELDLRNKLARVGPSVDG